MNIYVTASVGKGHTPLSAFDNALLKAGVCNYNLITLSSVIPPHTEIQLVDKYHTPPEDWGHKLYVVKAEIRGESVGMYMGAALGWYQLEDGRGVFVEHETTDKTYDASESNLKALVAHSVHDLCKHRNIEFDEERMGMKMIIKQVESQPTCALVLAVYKSEGWG